MLEYLNEIEAQIILWLPTVMSFILSTVIPFVVKVLNTKHTNKMSQQIDALNRKVDDLHANNVALASENAALKKTINKTLTKLVDNVYREDEEV